MKFQVGDVVRWNKGKLTHTVLAVGMLGDYEVVKIGDFFFPTDQYELFPKRMCPECAARGHEHILSDSTPEIDAVLMHGRDYLTLMTPENRALLVEALDNLEAVTR